MTNKDIEILSVNAVRDSIVTSGYLEPYIEENDKMPSFDGDVFIYTSKLKTKDTFIGKLPVQVKGTKKRNFVNDIISFSVPIIDLNNYLRSGGIIFFVVYINEVNLEKQVYYCDLTPVKIRQHLKAANGKKKAKIQLKKFPNDADEKSTIFLQCLNNCQKQCSFKNERLLTVDELNSLGKLNGFTIPISGFGKMDPIYALFNSDIYLYANIGDSDIPQPLDVSLSRIETEEIVEASITIDEKCFYSEIRILRNADKLIVKIGECFNICLNENSQNVEVSFKYSNSLRVLAKDLDFFVSSIENSGFMFNESKFSFTSDDFDELSIECEKERLIKIRKIVSLLDVLGCKKDLKLDLLNETDWNHIEYLITAIIDNQEIKLLKKDLPSVISIPVGELNFIVYLEKIGADGTLYKLYDFFKTELQVVAGNNESNKYEPISQFAFLTADNLVKADNLDCNVFLPSFTSFEMNDITVMATNAFLLELLNAYDIDNSNFDLYETAENLSIWLEDASAEYLPREIKALNRLQIRKRKYKLRKSEIEELIRIIETNNDESILVGAYLLLDQQTAAELHFGKLDLESQEAFKKYPIFHFWKENGGNS